VPSRILAISDLHLDQSRPDITATLLRFLRENRSNCGALFILGDLFEVWLGDDDSSELADTVATALSEFAAAGTAIYLMHGNRDFLIGDAYSRRCGASLIDEPYILQTGQGSVLLLHGDQLCTDDGDYQQFRQMVRADSWQQEFLAKPLSDRRAFARQARQRSQAATAVKADAIMDVNQDAVHRWLQDSQQAIMLHGHTHRPATHEFELPLAPQDDPPRKNPSHGKIQAQRIVLGDWDQQGWFAEISDEGIELKQFPFQS